MLADNILFKSHTLRIFQIQKLISSLIAMSPETALDS